MEHISALFSLPDDWILSRISLPSIDSVTLRFRVAALLDRDSYTPIEAIYKKSDQEFYDEFVRRYRVEPTNIPKLLAVLLLYNVPETLSRYFESLDIQAFRQQLEWMMLRIPNLVHWLYHPIYKNYRSVHDLILAHGRVVLLARLVVCFKEDNFEASREIVDKLISLPYYKEKIYSFIYVEGAKAETEQSALLIVSLLKDIGKLDTKIFGKMISILINTLLEKKYGYKEARKQLNNFSGNDDIIRRVENLMKALLKNGYDCRSFLKEAMNSTSLYYELKFLFEATSRVCTGLDLSYMYRSNESKHEIANEMLGEWLIESGRMK